MSAEPSFLIVVATYKRGAKLTGLLQALRPQVEGHPRRRMVVVNDGTHSGDYEAVMAPHLGWLEYRVLEQNRGPGLARQHGCEGATEDLIIFTDDDCVPPPWWIDRAEALARTLPTVDLFAGEACKSAPTHGGLRGVYQICSQIRLASILANQRVVCVPTAVMMVRRGAFEDAGGFTAEFSRLAEDTDLTHRIMSLGCALAQDPAWVTVHHSVATIGQYWRRLYGYGKGNARHFAKQKYSDRKIPFDYYLADWRKFYRKFFRHFPREDINSSSIGHFAFRLLRTVAERRGFKQNWPRYLEKYHTAPISPPEPGHWVAPMVIDGASSWNRSFNDWRQSQVV
ncbi:hypothetical protein MNBD_ALPHA09-2264 [hydrothermal vent metagenome]|uniref:Glycosyltransferase 2-like domain-containing protein n=1 Tax=hydrothermal vent metagenome TaxID=652676 RepID=A0A3B0TK10_9ZZZZ